MYDLSQQKCTQECKYIHICKNENKQWHPEGGFGNPRQDMKNVERQHQTNFQYDMYDRFENEYGN